MKGSVLKFVPSRSIHYLHCPYFLKLSNIVNIPIDEPHIVAIQKAQQFKKLVVNRLALRACELIPARSEGVTGCGWQGTEVHKIWECSGPT